MTNLYLSICFCVAGYISSTSILFWIRSSVKYFVYISFSKYCFEVENIFLSISNVWVLFDSFSVKVNSFLCIFKINLEYSSPSLNFVSPKIFIWQVNWFSDKISIILVYLFVDIILSKRLSFLPSSDINKLKIYILYK